MAWEGGSSQGLGGSKPLSIFQPCYRLPCSGSLTSQALRLEEKSAMMYRTNVLSCVVVNVPLYVTCVL